MHGASKQFRQRFASTTAARASNAGCRSGNRRRDLRMRLELSRNSQVSSIVILRLPSPRASNFLIPKPPDSGLHIQPGSTRQN